MFEEDSEENLKRAQHHLEFARIGQSTLNCEIHKILCDFEEHLDQVSIKYKTMAFTCFLAVCLACGFILSAEAIALPFNHFVSVILLSCIGFSGNILLWHLDINVYYRFVAAVFIEETFMEKKFPFLLKSGNTSFLTGSQREKTFSQNLTYLIYNFVFIVIAGFFSIKFFALNFINVSIVLFLTISLISLSYFFMIKLYKKLNGLIINSMKKRLSCFDKN